MSRARTLADQFNSDGDLALTPVASVNAGQIGGRRNLIINGAMQVFQRATSASNPGGGYDAADRWRQSQNNSGLNNFTIEQSTDAPDGFATSLKLTKSGAITVSSNQSAFIQQYFEGQNLQQLQYGGSGAKKVTLSFYVKSSLTGTWGVCLQDGEAGKHNAQTYTISSANTWEYKTVTFDGDTAAGIANDNSAEFDVQFVLGAGADYQTATTGSWQSGDKKTTSSQTQWPETNGATWFVTGVQLELGDTATDFEHRSFGEELSLCQRYYQMQVSGTGVASSSTNCDFNIQLQTSMRDAPTISSQDGEMQITNVTSADFNSSGLVVSGDPGRSGGDELYQGGRVRLSGFTGLAAGDDYIIDVNSSTPGKITYDAEL